MNGGGLPSERILFTEEQVAARIREVAAEISEKLSRAGFEADRRAERLGVFSDRAGARHRDPRENRLPGDFQFRRLPVARRSRHGAHRQGPGRPDRGRRRAAGGGHRRHRVHHPISCCRRWPDAGRARSAICTLLDRTVRRIVQVPVDFRCFEIPDRFVVGCGLDYKQLYRNLGYIAVMNPDKE